MSNNFLSGLFLTCSVLCITKTNCSSAQADLYYVNSSVCKMRQDNPFSKELMKIYTHALPQQCETESTLVLSSFNPTLAHYVLRINKYYAKGKRLQCIYHEIERVGKGEQSDKKAILRKGIHLRSPFIVPRHIESMLVNCYNAMNSKEIVQTNAFVFVQAKEDKKLNKRKERTRKPSVIMIGIDSLSRTNLRRSMPLLFKYFNDNGWHEMQGYTKVADNTFPNLLAVLTGHTPESAREHYCDYHKVGCLNQLPFVWHKYKRAGYVTAYAEDDSVINTFNNLKPGFQAQPVDYYPLSFFQIAEHFLQKRKRFGRIYCLGQKLSTSYIYDYCADFIARFIKKRPMFGLFWANQYSSADVLGASAFDETMVAYLELYRKKELFNESIVIFFSDHGSRYGRIRDLPEGFMNERLPALFIWLPFWFRRKHPDYVIALEQNRKRLSSNYDLHLTLQHILNPNGGAAKHHRNPVPGCPHCQSLFQPLPFNRSCNDAGIPQHYCACDEFWPVQAAEVEPIMPLVFKRINDFIAAKRLSANCSNLTLNKVQKVFKKQITKLEQPEISIYRIYFNALPSKPKFELTVPYNNYTKDIRFDVEDISRLNAYANDSHCIQVKEAFKICVCHNNVHATIEKISTTERVL